MSSKHIVRHKLIDRLFHWVLAISILILLLSGLLPVYGFDASLVVIHWTTGLILSAVLFIHICRSLFWKSLSSSIMLSRADFSVRNKKTGKYSGAQKLMHLAIAMMSLAAIITGLMMMVRIDTPLWERDPYWLNADTWGIVYFIHGLIALCFVSVIMLHVYFAVRPENRMYLRSIFKGWISQEEYERNHEPELWPQNQSE
jgi:formate dehydrogenase subunit gamma